MTIELTQEQENALFNNGSKQQRVVIPIDKVEFVLIRKDDFDKLAEELEDEQLQRAFGKVSMRSAAKRLMEDE